MKELYRDVSFVTYEVLDGKVSLPEGSEIVSVVTADQGELADRPTIVAVTVAVTTGRYDGTGRSVFRDELAPPAKQHDHA